MRTLLGFLLCLELMTSASAGSLKVSCEADYGGVMQRVSVLPSSDPFAFHTMELGTRFRFSVQWLESRSKLKTFVHERDDRAPILLHAAEYPLTGSACPKPSTEFGLNKVYSSDLGRELFFQCSARCE